LDVDRNSVRRKENIVEDQDRRTPEEEVDVEGHALRDVQDVQEVQAKDDDDFEAHSLRDVQDVQDVQRGDEDVQDVL
jgi:hypothetical protein